MIRFLDRLSSRPQRLRWWPGGRLKHGDAAIVRLRAAHVSFDDSVLALRKAALDHVDCQDLASTALRANLDWLASRLGPAPDLHRDDGRQGTSAAARP